MHVGTLRGCGDTIPTSSEPHQHHAGILSSFLVNITGATRRLGSWSARGNQQYGLTRFNLARNEGIRLDIASRDMAYQGNSE